jgi:branched-chain amino acid aminotransferase
MLNYNGRILSKDEVSISPDNRAFKYGDGIFETLKVERRKVLFTEDHYFRLMASARMLRMQLSMDFTLEYFESEIIKLVEACDLTNARVRFSVFRRVGGLYTPTNNETDYLIEASDLKVLVKESYEVELYKDHYVYSGLLSTIKSTNRLINIVASIFKEENNYDNCILLNEKKHIAEASNGNIFLVINDTIVTPALTEGCIKGIIRKKILEIVKKDPNLTLEEREISPFELQKADEVFITNAIIGIQPVTKYRRKEYKVEISKALGNKLKGLALLS